MSTTTFDAARADYRSGLRWFFTGIPLLFTVVAALAWRETEVGGGPQWLVFLVGLPLVAAWVLWRTRDAAVTVTAAGRLRRRSVTGDQTAELSRMAEVMVLPSLSYEDQIGAAHQPEYGYLVRDRDGREVSVARGLPWTDTAPVLAEVVRALRSSQGRCDPLTWEVLHRDAGLAPAPFPDRLTRPPEDGWDTPLGILRKQRASTLTPLFALAGTPLVGAAVGFFGLISDTPGQALTALAGGVLTTGVFWGLLWQVVRRGDRDQVTIDADGRLHAVTRRTRFLTLGYRIDEGAVDLTRLSRVQTVPGSYTHESKRDQPQWWRLELEDDTGAAAAINLMHPRTPRATLFPQLAWHLGRSGVDLDAVTRRTVELRLGRTLGPAPAR